VPEVRPVSPSDWAVALVPVAVPGLAAVVTSPTAEEQLPVVKEVVE